MLGIVCVDIVIDTKVSTRYILDLEKGIEACIDTQENKMPNIPLAAVNQQEESIQAPIGSTTSIAFGSVQMDGEGLFVGYEKERYIIVGLPSDFNGIDLKPGQQLRLNYNCSGNAYSYATSVLHYLEKFGLVFLSHPKSMKTNSLRREDRVSCRIPATANIQSKALKGMVTDISHHGCQFCVKIPATFKLHQVSMLTDVHLSLTLSDSEDPKSFKCKVRNTNFDESRIVLGIEFDALEERFSQRLESYIKKMKVLQ